MKMILLFDQIISMTNSPDFLKSEEKEACTKTLEKEIAIVENFNKGK